jgi:hypothetical protein
VFIHCRCLWRSIGGCEWAYFWYDTPRGRSNVGIHIEGEYCDGIVDYTCENIGLPLDSPMLKEFVRNIILPIVEPGTRDAWHALLESD